MSIKCIGIHYTFFSNKHLIFEKNCKRLSLFKGKIPLESLSVFSDEKNEEFLQNSFIGTIVLRPLLWKLYWTHVIERRKISHKRIVCADNAVRLHCLWS